MGRQEVTLLPVARDAAKILGQQVALARRDRQWTMSELAARSGVSVHTVRSIEAGRPTVSLGNAFNVAVIAGVHLFTDSASELTLARTLGDQQLRLLPERVKPRETRGDDADLDF